MANEMEGAALVVSRAGIAEASSFNEQLVKITADCREALAATPPIGEVKDAEDYRYLKAALANLRKQKKEAEAWRKSITGQLDDAKRAVTKCVGQSTAELDDAVAKMATLKASTEDGWRAEKRGRLEAYWERKYPALALCTGEAAEPLVPFGRILDPDWLKRASELSSDAKAERAMDAIADGIAAGQRAIECIEGDDDLRARALAGLFRTLDAGAAIEAAKEEQRRARDIERVASRPAPVTEVRAADAPTELSQAVADVVRAAGAPAPEPAPEPEPRGWRIVIECATPDEVRHVKEIMVGHGVHGRIERI